MLPPNQPLTKDAARKLMALDVQDKEILTYEKLDECTPHGVGSVTSVSLAARTARCWRIWRRGTCRAS